MPNIEYPLTVGQPLPRSLIHGGRVLDLADWQSPRFLVGADTGEVFAVVESAEGPSVVGLIQTPEALEGFLTDRRVLWLDESAEQEAPAPEAPAPEAPAPTDRPRRRLLGRLLGGSR